MGQLLDFVDRRGDHDNTIVVFVVDNGWIQQTGELRTTSVFFRPNFNRTRGPFAPKSKNSPYDGGLRTPVLVRWPARIRPGRHTGLVSSIDLAPTILSACGITPPEEMPGVNLLDVATGAKQRLDRRTIFGEVYFHAARQSLEPRLNLTHRWARFNDWKLIDSYARSLELYNVVQDPYEDHNVVTQQPRIVRRMLASLDEWWDGQ